MRTKISNGVKKRRSRRWRVARRLAFFVFALFIIGAVTGGAGALVLIQSLPNPERISDRAVAESTKIYDRTGKVLLYEIHGEEKRTLVSFSEIPDVVKHATLAAEDIRFYQHGALDGKSIIRAALTNLRRGGIVQGGSTITQQLIKNSLLGPERTFQKKIKEQVLAILLERKYSKDEILGLYLNQIPYGSNAYGIAAASQTFFGKEVGELTAEEAATLASLPKAPTHFSPHGSYKDDLLNRRNWVLARMASAEFLDDEELAAGQAMPLHAIPPKRSINAPHFVLYVKEYLQEKYGEEFVERGGFRVTTTLDVDLQQAAEKTIREGAQRSEEIARAANASLVAIDPKTGDILAMVGSRDYWADPYPHACKPGVNCRFDPHVNIALRPRQPGSAFKPFVYATAFKKGYAPETVLFDAFTEFNTRCNIDGTPGPTVNDPKECYHPKNYDDQFRGPVPLRRALAQSLNVPSVKLLYLTGIEDSIATAKSMGISTLDDPKRFGLSLVLGGAEVNLLEMTSAFGVFAQDGILHPKTAILRIESSKGEIVEEKKEVALPIIDTEVSRTINDVLSDNDARVPVFNPRSSLYFVDRRVAAKTGTTQDYRDAWTIGYTPSLVVGVWIGNSDNTPMQKSGPSVMVAAPVWHQFMEFALNRRPPETFIPPEKRVPENPALRGVYRQEPVIRIDRVSRKIATPYTPLELIEEIGLGEVRTILSFVDKNNPLGPTPANPIHDPQYAHWQGGIERWLASHPLPAPPAISSQTDDLHLPEKWPRIALLQPRKDLSLSNVKEVTISVASTFPLREISLFVDDALAGSKTAPLLSTTFVFPLPEALSIGKHQIKAAAYDAVGNKETLQEDIVISE